MAGIVITALLSVSMWVAIWLLTKRRRLPAPTPALPGQLTAAERRKLYKRLGIDPEVMARQRPYGGPVIPLQPELRRRRSTRA